MDDALAPGTSARPAASAGDTAWPLFDVAICTPRLTIRCADDRRLRDVAQVAAEGIHRADELPFYDRWTLQPPGILQRNLLQHGWGLRAMWQPNRWTFVGAVELDGRVIGLQSLGAEQFAERRTVTSWSWIGLPFQGKGIGTEMRRAILHFAFAGLGARVALSAAFADNGASNAVSRRLGYVNYADEVVQRDGSDATERRWRLERDAWATQRREDIHVVGLDAARGFFDESVASAVWAVRE